MAKNLEQERNRLTFSEDDDEVLTIRYDDEVVLEWYDGGNIDSPRGFDLVATDL